MKSSKLETESQETLELCDQGWYEIEGDTISLEEPPYWPEQTISPADIHGDWESMDQDPSTVLVVDEIQMAHHRESLLDSYDGNLAKGRKAEIIITDLESLISGSFPGLMTSLVLNFAHPFVPGGNFEEGTRGQEQTLCRHSTLYESLCSDEAQIMYQHNAELLRNGRSVFSDYMLISPFVRAFRYPDGQLMEEPYGVAVASVPPPYAPAADKGDPEAVSVDDQLRAFLFTAAGLGYTTLVLGAWGCRNGGHSPAAIADSFYRLLIKEHMSVLFDWIVFAMPDKEEFRVFRQTFGAEAVCMNADELGQRAQEIMSRKYEFMDENLPICNYENEIEGANLGFAQGIMDDGTPYVAELYTDTVGDVQMSILYPCEDGREEDEPAAEVDEVQPNLTLKPGSQEILPYHTIAPKQGFGILDIGMTDLGADETLEASMENVQKLKDNNILEFTTQFENGAVFYRKDANDHILTQVVVSLTDNGKTTAVTSLDFHPFVTRKPQSTAEIVPFPKLK